MNMSSRPQQILKTLSEAKKQRTFSNVRCSFKEAVTNKAAPIGVRQASYP